MLEEIRIRDLGVIAESVLELGPGFTAITGETGAGKTMVVTALGLLLGARADSGAVRSGAKAARVEGLLKVDPDAPWAAALAAGVEEVGGEIEDDGLVVARRISAEGRSRAFAGGVTVPVTALGALVDPLVAVHGQSDQHRLLASAAQREALDRFAGGHAADLLAAYADCYRRLRAAEDELADVVRTARDRAQEADLLRFGLEEVAAVDPQPGEDQALAGEESRLGHADRLRTAAEQARESLSSETGTPDALGAVGAARKILDGVRDHDPEAAGLADRLAELGYLLTDLAADVSSYAAALESDPARLAAVSERRAALVSLTRKYGETVDEVLAWAERGAVRLAELDGTDERIEELRARCAALRDELATHGTALSKVRAETAAELGAVVSREVQALAMPAAEVSVAVIQHPDNEGLDVGGRRLAYGPTGLDEVEILLAANAGDRPRSLAKSASGGELSRVMLAVEVALAASHPVPTFVFDEGDAAVEVGRRLAVLARHAQVLVVTHLPQVAAFADQHVVVVKSSDGSVTTSGLSRLDDTGRVRELSRMLAGLEDSETALAHAEELLATARQTRSRG
jgi:DNA repair protein RecN (Recombination protein N)